MRTTKSGNQLDVAVDDSTIEVSSDALQIKTTYPGQASITTLGTITTGVWNGTAIAATSGGTGLTSYSTGDIIRASGINTSKMHYHLVQMAKFYNQTVVMLLTAI